MSSLLPAAVAGFSLGASFIIAIGTQNAYVLKQGLLRRHVLPVVLLCAVADAVLIILGVAGFGRLISTVPVLLKILTYGGVIFLLVYGFLAARRALKGSEILTVDKAKSQALWPVLATTAAFTFLNPHVYLDTVILLGTVSTRYTGDARTAFAIGGITASFVWFFALGFGARILAPLFRRAISWRILDGVIAIIMWTIAAGLVYSQVQS